MLFFTLIGATFNSLHQLRPREWPHSHERPFIKQVPTNPSHLLPLQTPNSKCQYFKTWAAYQTVASVGLLCTWKVYDHNQLLQPFHRILLGAFCIEILHYSVWTLILLNSISDEKEEVHAKEQLAWVSNTKKVCFSDQSKQLWVPSCQLYLSPKVSRM